MMVRFISFLKTFLSFKNSPKMNLSLLKKSKLADKPLGSEMLHSAAVESGRDGYIDPETGFFVFSSIYHKKRGYCCESGCRHCPFGLNKTP